MFWNKKNTEAENRAKRAELELQMANMRLAQYDSLMANLRKHDWFEFNSSGGIVGHDKDEPEDSLCCATAYCWPDPKFRLTLAYI